MVTVTTYSKPPEYLLADLQRVLAECEADFLHEKWARIAAAAGQPHALIDHVPGVTTHDLAPKPPVR